jgi:hypothetical protein
VSTDAARKDALQDLAAFEAAAFRFGQQAREVLAGLPEGMPEPFSILPRFSSRADASHELVHGSGSYLHIVVPWEGLDAWAALFEASVEKRYDKLPSGYSCHARADGERLGITVHIGCTQSITAAEWQELENDGATLGGYR